MGLENLLSAPHIILLVVVALLIFGPRRLPELGGAVGKTIREFRKSMDEARAQVQTATAVDNSKGAIAGVAAGTTTEAGKPN